MPSVKMEREIALAKKLASEKGRKDLNIKKPKDAYSQELPTDSDTNQANSKATQSPADYYGLFELDPQKLIQGFVMSEVLGKPKCKRR